MTCRAPHVLFVIVLGLMPLTGCKIVKTPEPGSEAAGSATATPADDAARMARMAAEIFAAKVVPFVAEQAVDLSTLRDAVAGGLDAAGAQHGHRPESEGSPWNFLVKGQGKVVKADTASRAAKLELDSDGDGVADVTVQLGPVIKGTSLRDAADFLVFTDFRDQIEFAKLARALNDEAHKALRLPEGDLTGRRFAFEGALTLRAKGDALLLVPTQLSEVP
ncbi:DUF2291 family protein [Gemmobacter caeruleus]|uniref:DUF2291 family protein n=1 Tax=Gemmobacter caeruleus TaxID=2595004 RepID=UPI0011ECD3EE|nr:DUF2291 domain-containing protein [Gemmobacter caeruleus]